jgi:hypothetical protein
MFSNCYQFWLLDLYKTTMLWVLKPLLPYLIAQQKRKKNNVNRQLLYAAEKVHILLLQSHSYYTLCDRHVLTFSTESY